MQQLLMALFAFCALPTTLYAAKASTKPAKQIAKQSAKAPALRLPKKLEKKLEKTAPRKHAKKAPMKIKFGVYITHIFDINFVKNQYKVQFWSWFHHNKKTYKPNKTTEIMNARKFSRHIPNEEFVKGIHWDTAFIKADINQQWKVKRFPFDEQKLLIHLEDVNLAASKLVILPDTKASKIAPNALPQGWELKSFKVSRGVNHYETAFGDPAAKSGTSEKFSRFTVTIVLKRKGWRLFFTTFTGFFVGIALVLIVFFVNIFPRIQSLIPLTTTLSLCTGALFASVGGIYVLNSQMSYTTDFTFADSILITTFVGIAFAIAGSVIAEVTAKMEKTSIGTNLNRALLGIYVLICIFFPSTTFFG